MTVGVHELTSKGDSSANMSKLLHQVRLLDDVHIKSTTSIEILCNIITFISQGNRFSKADTSDIFFKINKLFSCNSDHLKRILYMTLGHIDFCQNEAFMLTNMVLKEVNSGYKMNAGKALRILPVLINDSNVLQFDRTISMSLLDKDEYISTSGLICAYTMFKDYPEIVSKWTTQIFESIKQSNGHAAYIGLILYSEIKKSDPISLEKMVLDIVKGSR